MSILEAAGGSSEGFDQVGTYDFFRQRNQAPGWALDPYGLRELLNTGLANLGRAERYQIRMTSNRIEALSWIVASVCQGLPAATLLFGHHWSLVDGYEGKPAGAVESVSKLWTHVPVPNLPHDSLPPHGKSDRCGSGGSYGKREQSVLVGSWWSTYSRASQRLTADFDASFVVLGTALQPVPVASAEPPVLAPPLAGLGGEWAAAAESGASLLVAALPLVFPELAAELTGLAPGRLLRVHSLAEGLPPYELLTLRAGAQSRHWLELQRGEPYYASLAMTSGSSEPIDLDQTRAIATLLRPDSPVATVEEGWSWRPCPEAPSPYLPFRIVHLADFSRVYVRIDGAAFNSLSEPIPGS